MQGGSRTPLGGRGRHGQVFDDRAVDFGEVRVGSAEKDFLSPLAFAHTEAENDLALFGSYAHEQKQFLHFFFSPLGFPLT